jgi:hypothetical protein
MYHKCVSAIKTNEPQIHSYSRFTVFFLILGTIYFNKYLSSYKLLPFYTEFLVSLPVSKLCDRRW